MSGCSWVSEVFWFMKSIMLLLILRSLSLFSLPKNSISSSLLWNSLKSSHICDLSGAPGVGQKVRPFSRDLSCGSVSSVLERLMTVCPM